jgi:hypothetical protein
MKGSFIRLEKESKESASHTTVNVLMLLMLQYASSRPFPSRTHLSHVQPAGSSTPRQPEEAQIAGCPAQSP